jgi:hypothetical protein
MSKYFIVDAIQVIVLLATHCLVNPKLKKTIVSKLYREVGKLNNYKSLPDFIRLAYVMHAYL